MAKATTVTIVQIANEMKVSPKRARAVLRSKGYARDGATRWVFDLDEKATIKDLIRASRKRANFTPATSRPSLSSSIEQEVGTSAH